MLLLTAANGNQGRLLVPRLLEAGIPFRACTRSPESAEMLRAQGVADIIVGDIAEPKIIARAMLGVAQIHHIGPSAHPREPQMGFQMFYAAQNAGVAPFSFTPVPHATPPTPP